MIDWNKPLQMKLTKPCGHFQVFFDDFMDWQEVEVTDQSDTLLYVKVCGKVMSIPKTQQVFTRLFGGTSVELEVRNKPIATVQELTKEEHAYVHGFDPVEKPSHYAEGRKYETIDVIEDWDLGYHISNALKYLSRYNRKGDGVQDLKKAVWYLQRKIKQVE